MLTPLNQTATTGAIGPAASGSISRPADADDLVLDRGDVRIDRLRRVVTVGDRRPRLRRRQFDLLVALAAAEGRVVTRAALLWATGSGARDPRTRTIDMQVSQLRAALGACDVSIETARGIGYALVVRDGSGLDPRTGAAPCKQSFARGLPLDHEAITDAP
jgi:DNA-binding response OmpR family regulator